MTEVVAALIWKEGKFLACQRPAHKARGLLWEFVGGKVELGESKEQALIRECQEELAITVVPDRIFMEVTHEYPDMTVHLTLFNASIVEGQPQMLEHNDIRWLSPYEVTLYDFCPADEVILQKLQELAVFVQYPPCTTCQKAKKWLDEQGAAYVSRHIKEAKPSYEELKEWQQRSGLPLKKFFNTSGLLYKSLALKDKLPTMSEEEQLQLLASDGMLVKRPILVMKDRVLVGKDVYTL